MPRELRFGKPGYARSEVEGEDAKPIKLANVFYVACDLIILNHRKLERVQSLIVMEASISATTITGKAIPDDCTKEIGITREGDVGTRRIKRRVNVAGRSDVDRLSAGIRSESIELKMTGTT